MSLCNVTIQKITVSMYIELKLSMLAVNCDHNKIHKKFTVMLNQCLFQCNTFFKIMVFEAKKKKKLSQYLSCRCISHSFRQLRHTDHHNLLSTIQFVSVCGLG